MVRCIIIIFLHGSHASPMWILCLRPFALFCVSGHGDAFSYIYYILIYTWYNTSKPPVTSWAISLWKNWGPTKLTTCNPIVLPGVLLSPLPAMQLHAVFDAAAAMRIWIIILLMMWLCRKVLIIYHVTYYMANSCVWPLSCNKRFCSFRGVHRCTQGGRNWASRWHVDSAIPWLAISMVYYIYYVGNFLVWGFVWWVIIFCKRWSLSIYAYNWHSLVLGEANQRGSEKKHALANSMLFGIWADTQTITLIHRITNSHSCRADTCTPHDNWHARPHRLTACHQRENQRGYLLYLNLKLVGVVLLVIYQV